ncbi:unnamed protein product [Ixodes pacificus]
MSTNNMSIVVGDLDNDGQRDRVFFEAHHATSILSSETALVLIAFTVVACITVLCWCVFFAISKRNRLGGCLDPHLRKSTKDGQSSRNTQGPAAPPPAQTFPYPDFAHHAHLRPHTIGVPMLSTLPELPELGSGNSFVNQSFHPPGWKYTPESCGF